MPILSDSKNPSLVSVCLKPQITGLKKQAQRKNVKEDHNVGALMSHFPIKSSPMAR